MEHERDHDETADDADDRERADTVEEIEQDPSHEPPEEGLKDLKGG